MINKLILEDIKELYICGEKGYIERVLKIDLFRKIKVKIIDLDSELEISNFEVVSVKDLPISSIKVLIAARLINKYVMKLQNLNVNFDMVEGSYFGVKSTSFLNFETSGELEYSNNIILNLGVNSTYKIENSMFYFNNKPANINVGYNSTIMINSSTIEDNVHIMLGNNSELIIDDSAYLSKDIDIIIGSNVKVYIGKNVLLSSNSLINCADYCDLTIGNNSTFGPFLEIYTYAPIKIGEDAMFSSFCYMDSGDGHDLFISGKKNYPKEINIGSHTWIGYGCKILKGTSLCDNSVVGANTLLKNKETSVPAIIFGNPNQVISESFTWNRDYTAYKEIREKNRRIK